MNSKHRKQAAEKRKREEVWSQIANDCRQEGFHNLADLADKLAQEPRIWIGTGATGEPNE